MNRMRLTWFLLASVAAAGQSADITGWQGLPWGSPKPAALKAFQSFHVHECRTASETSCAGKAGTDELTIEDYRVNGVSYEVHLLFLPKSGLGMVTLTSDDQRDSFRNVLSELTHRYGKPGLQSEYDGAKEITRTKWNWVKPHGHLSLSSGDGEEFYTITYSARN